MKSRGVEFFVILGVFIGLGLVTKPIAKKASDHGTVGGEMAALDASVGQLGQGVSLAIMGGYRSLVANMVWLSLNSDWEEKDFAATAAKIRLATAIDPRPKSFWLNGARIMANDMPAWIVGELEAEKLFETEEGAVHRRRFARLALDYLDAARKSHPEAPEILIEKATIQWRKLDDLEAAAALFSEVVQLAAAPYFADRIYAELLERLGRREEALRHLESIVDDLPYGDPQAMKPVVEYRIRKLRMMVEGSEG